MVILTKIRNVKDPIRDVTENAGIDFFVPERDPSFVKDLMTLNPKVDMFDECISLYPLQGILIPSGIRTYFENNIALVAFNKSGVATKRQLMIGAEVDDASYRGELHIHVINVSDQYVQIRWGEKLAQFIPLYIDNSPHQLVLEDEYNKIASKSNRGTGGFGSSGT